MSDPTREELEAQAKALGLNYPANIGDKKLAQRVAEASAEKEPVREIVVVGPKKGRWRSGRRFDRTPTRIPLGDLTEEELEALHADPKLEVGMMPVDATE